jgi:hypothetical protein
MSSEDLERYEAEAELALYREYRDVVSMFRYVVETDRRNYLANEVRTLEPDASGVVRYELVDAWVWDMYRQSRFVSKVTITSPRTVIVEELPEREL